jgi:hypothetical protein
MNYNKIKKELPKIYWKLLNTPRLIEKPAKRNLHVRICQILNK